MSNSEQAYVVFTEGDCEGKSMKTLGYARGDPEDIKIHYDRMKTYEILLRPIEIIDITPESVRETRDLVEEKSDLEERLAQVKRDLERRGIR